MTKHPLAEVEQIQTDFGFTMVVLEPFQNYLRTGQKWMLFLLDVQQQINMIYGQQTEIGILTYIGWPRL